MNGGEGLSGSVVVLSTHLDDGVFSLGAAMARAAREGHMIRMLTVLAGDPESDRPATDWDAAAGFRTAGEAARRRRDEDIEACRILGVVPEWLPYSDHQHGPRPPDEEVWSAVGEAVGEADAVLVPGYPLIHPDHAWLSELALGRPTPGGATLGVYVEQPYEHNRRRAGPPVVPSAPGVDFGTWRRLPASGRDRRAKRRAFGAYRSQLGLVSKKPLLSWRVTLVERYRGGEAVAWASRRNHRS